MSLICLEPQHRLEEEKQYPVAQVWAWLTASWECSPGAGTPLCLRPPPLGHRAHLLAVGPACLVPGCALLEGRSIEQLLCAGQGTGDVEGTRQAEALLWVSGVDQVLLQAGGVLGECSTE